MLKTFVILISVITISLAATFTFADEIKSAETATGSEVAEEVSIMDQPVDFSTAENVEKSLQAVSDQAGEANALQLKSAMKYVMYYDLSVSHDKVKMHKKLDGRTPNEIIAKMKR